MLIYHKGYIDGYITVILGGYMKVILTKISDSDYEVFKKLCEERGMSVYQCARAIIYKFMSDNGYTSGNLPFQVRIMQLEEKVNEWETRWDSINEKYEKMEQECARLKEVIKELMKKVEQLEQSNKHNVGLTQFSRKR